MRLRPCLIIISLMRILSNANATKGKYTVIAPGTIHCNQKYTVAVAVHHTIEPCKIKVGISSHFYQLVKVSKNEVKNVKFILPCFEKGTFNLTTEGIDCLDNFKNTTKLIYNKFNNHVIIQTDKDLYAPGDDINFRILFLDKDSRPAKPRNGALIWFSDGKRNRIKEINNFETNKGVYTGKFRVSEFPVTGNWHLGVSNGDEFNRTLHFEINKYVFPKFIVNVEATKSVSVKDGKLRVIVRAYYNYGKPLDGKVTVALFLESYNTVKKPPVLIKTSQIVNGKAKTDFIVKEYDAYLLYKSSLYHMNIVATVEEKFTGVKINGTASSTIYSYRYLINCINYDPFERFESDKEKDVVFQITYIDGTYLSDIKSTVDLTYKEVLRKNNWWRREPKFDNDSLVSLLSKNHAFIFKGHMNETGFVTFKVALPELPQYDDYSHYYSLHIKYLDEQHEVCNTHLYWYRKQFNSPKEEEKKSNEYFTLEDKFVSANRLYLKKASQFTLFSSQRLFYFDYNVIGRGNILESGRIEVPGKPKEYNLTLTPKSSWAPSFCIYVNYVDGKGEYHFAEQPYEVVLELENQINITAAKQAKPGQEVTITIHTAPNSFVGLMAVDQRAFALKPNYDLNFYEVNRVLGSYSTYTLPQGGHSIYPGEISGCVTLTNANYLYSISWPRNMKRDWLRAGNRGAATHSASRGAGYSTNVKTTKNGSPTWIFADIEDTDAAVFNWTIKIPETVTSWVLTAFSLNPQKGLAVTREQTKITTVLPLTISIRLPYSVKRGEVINVPAWVFNYLDSALDVKITLHKKDDEFEFIKFDNEVVNEEKLSKSIRVADRGAAGVSFLVKPKVVGNIMLKFTAFSQVASESIYKALKVELEGITVHVSRACFVNLNKGPPNFRSSFKLDLPQNLVPDSKRLEVEVMADILRPVLNNLDNFWRLPTGCGEQTMSTLLPYYLVMKYLKSAKGLTLEMETKLRYNLEIGYQNILIYRHRDGSFSSFGPTSIKEKPRNGSTWLTAYVVRSLQQFKEFINVDNKIIEKGLDYLSKQQAANGTYTEKGDYFYVSQRNHVTLTSFAVLAIMENPTYVEKYSKEFNKGLEFVAQNIDKSDSLLAQAIGTFTLKKARHAKAKYEMYKLKDLAKTESDRMWWSAEKQRCDYIGWCYVFSRDVEITSYALLALLDQYYTNIEDVYHIINWLVAQRNSNGGFASTQATVIGLTALIEFAKLADYESTRMTVVIGSKEVVETINLSEDEGIFYKYIEMPAATREINLTAKGTGLALLQISYQYNVIKMDPSPSFIIKTAKFFDKNTPLRFYMIVCVYYVNERDSSNMALLEISTPSGYVIDGESLKEAKESKRVSSIELKNVDTLLVVYFDRLYRNEGTCLLVQAIRTHAVALQKPATIVLYDYYDTEKRATVFYEVKSKLCDICEAEEECSKCLPGMGSLTI